MQRYERRLTSAILTISALLGVTFALITPAWANVEEPGHFEYIRFVVQHGKLPQPGDTDPDIQQQIIGSFVWAHHQWGIGGPMLNARVARAWGIEEGADWQRVREELAQRPGYESLAGRTLTSTEQLGEAPGYYLLAAASQLIMPGAGVEGQLLAARFASVLLGVLAVWLAALGARELFPGRWTLRLAAPALLALLPSFVVLQSTVNNTIAAVMALTLAVYAAIRAVRRGFSSLNLLLLGAAVAACLLSKSTAYVGVLVVLLAVPLMRRRAWPAWVTAALGAIGVLLIVLLFRWQWPASWYPASDQAQQVEDAPVGHRVVALSPDAAPRTMWQVLPAPTVQQLRGQTVTLGAWMRTAEEPLEAQLPSLWSAPNEGSLERVSSEAVTAQIGPAWSFQSTVITVPDDAQCMAVRFSAAGAAEVQPRAFDGIVMALGERTAEEPPVFTDPAGTRGQWAGEPFNNILLNGSLERGQPLLRPELADLLTVRVADMSVDINMRLATFFDWRANWSMLSQSLRWLFTSFWSRFGWVNPGLPVWAVAGLAALTGVSAAGLVLYSVREGPARPLWQRRALALSLLGGVMVVGVAVLRLDPVKLPQYCDLYQGRFLSTGYYVVPGALPLLMLWYLGLEAWLPRRWQRWLLVACIMGFFTLTLGTLLGRMIPSFLDAYGVDIPASLFIRLWGGIP